jgi:hypothetical protein
LGVEENHADSRGVSVIADKPELPAEREGFTCQEAMNV